MNFFNVEFFSWVAVLHELLQCGSLPWGVVLQEQAAPAWVPCGATGPAKDLLQGGLLSPLHLQVLSGASSCVDSP